MALSLDPLIATVHKDPSSLDAIAGFFNAAAVATESYPGALKELRDRYKDDYLPSATFRAEMTDSQAEVTYLRGVTARANELDKPEAFFNTYPHLKAEPVVPAWDQARREMVNEITSTTGKLGGTISAPVTASFRRRPVG
ncbi:MAG TPA: hypothetical protein VEF76_00385 [Patescibacteria group bacterium]|nr:hypothetical protein [Patescibacteria group bacterium]